MDQKSWQPTTMPAHKDAKSLTPVALGHICSARCACPVWNRRTNEWTCGGWSIKDGGRVRKSWQKGGRKDEGGQQKRSPSIRSYFSCEWEVLICILHIEHRSCSSTFRILYFGSNYHRWLKVLTLITLNFRLREKSFHFLKLGKLFWMNDNLLFYHNKKFNIILY